MINEIGRKAVTPFVLEKSAEEKPSKELRAPELPKGIDFAAITKQIDDKNKDGEVDVLDLIDKERLLSQELQVKPSGKLDRFV